ncbi:MAG: hypothetical protein ABI583_01125 [Betaproteobacteria bacterium]
MANRYVWGKDQAIARWLVRSRLDGLTKLMVGVQPHEIDKVAVLERLKANSVPAAIKLKTLLAAA